MKPDNKLGFSSEKKMGHRIGSCQKIHFHTHLDDIMRNVNHQMNRIDIVSLIINEIIHQVYGIKKAKNSDLKEIKSIYVGDLRLNYWGLNEQDVLMLILLSPLLQYDKDFVITWELDDYLDDMENMVCSKHGCRIREAYQWPTCMNKAGDRLIHLDRHYICQKKRCSKRCGKYHCVPCSKVVKSKC